MGEELPPDPTAGTTSEALLAMLETGKQWIDLTVAYRAAALEAGFSADEASAMAVEYHRWMLNIVRRPQS